MLTQKDVLATAVVFSDTDVRAAWKSSPLSHLTLFLSDTKYRALPKAMWENILAEHLSSGETYVPEFFDCDKFSLIFAAKVVEDFEVNGVAMVYDASGGHSYNALLEVADDGKTLSWHQSEPQTDAQVSSDSAIPTGVHPYLATSGFAIIP